MNVLPQVYTNCVCRTEINNLVLTTSSLMLKKCAQMLYQFQLASVINICTAIVRKAKVPKVVFQSSFKYFCENDFLSIESSDRVHCVGYINICLHLHSSKYLISSVRYLQHEGLTAERTQETLFYSSRTNIDRYFHSGD